MTMEITGLWGVAQAILITLISVLLVWGLYAGINYLRTQNKNKTIQWLAQLAYSKAERAGHTYLSGENDKGTAKFEEAVQALTDMLATHKIKVDPVTVVNAVQWAWQKLEGAPKASGSTAVINTELVGSDERMEEAAEKAIHRVLEK